MVTTSKASTPEVKTEAPFTREELKSVLEEHLAANLRHQFGNGSPNMHGPKPGAQPSQPPKKFTLINFSIVVGILGIIITANSMLPCGSSPFPGVNMHCTQNQSGTFDFTMLNNMLNAQGQIFADALTGDSTNARLPSVVKNGEAAMRDLRQSVLHSNLRSKSAIVEEISIVIDSSREISEELQRFGSDTGYATTRIIYFTKETHRQISNIALSIPTLDSPYQILVYSGKAALAAMGMSSDIKFIRARYMEMSVNMREDIGKLRDRVLGIKGKIRRMEIALRSIQDLAGRDGVDVKGDLKKVMGTLWYKIAGGYGDKIDDLREQKNVIDDTIEYCSRAGRHVDVVLLQLNKMDQDMANLGEAIGGVRYARIDPHEIKMHLEVVEKMTEVLASTLNRSQAIADAEYNAMLKKGFRDIGY